MSAPEEPAEASGQGEEAAQNNKAFDLEKQKALALQALPPRGRESPAFKQFYKSKLCDDYLCAALDHFAALLRVDDMAMARMAGKKPQDILPPGPEEKAAATLLNQTVKEVSTYYCYTIMRFSRYQAAQQDRMFFESLYEFITNIVVAAFPNQHRFRIEDEIGRIVRTDTFNLTRRKNDSNHHTKMQFSSRELYVLRYAGDGFMGRRILAALHPRRHAGDSVNQAVSRRSPLAAMLVPSAKELSEKSETTVKKERSLSPPKSRVSMTSLPDIRSPHKGAESPLEMKKRMARSVSPIVPRSPTMAMSTNIEELRAASAMGRQQRGVFGREKRSGRVSRQVPFTTGDAP